MQHNYSYHQFIPEDFSLNSRVWIYQCGRMLTMQEAFSIEPILETFINTWQSHGSPVKGYANLLFGQFIVVMADETNCTVGGCSTDSSVRLIKQIEHDLKVDMFNRQNLAFIVKDKLQVIPMQQLMYALENGFVTGDTLFFNNLVATKQELLNNWIIPVKNSWLSTRYNLNKDFAHSAN